MVLDLDQICPEALRLFGTRKIPQGTARAIGRMKPAQQVKIAELMVSVNDMTLPFVKALLLATPASELRYPTKKKPLQGVSQADQRVLRRLFKTMSAELRAVQADYAPIMLNQIVTNGYLARLLDNERIADFLQRNHPEEYAALKKLH